MASRQNASPSKVKTASGWASAHRGKWGRLTPWKMDEKLKSENMQKREQFSMFMLYFENNEGRQV